jgi:hypothetical protein
VFIIFIIFLNIIGDAINCLLCFMSLFVVTCLCRFHFSDVYLGIYMVHFGVILVLFHCCMLFNGIVYML